MRNLRLLFIAVILFVGLVGLAAAGDLTGKWNLNVTGTPHGDMAATLTLAHKDEEVKGTFSAHGNEHKMAGTFRNGTLELESTDTPADKSLNLKAKMQDDGTLSGYLSSPMGDMKWTAARAKDGK